MPSTDGWRRTPDSREDGVFRRPVPRTGPVALVALLGFIGLPPLFCVAGLLAAGVGMATFLLLAWAMALMTTGLAAWRIWRLTGGGPALRLWGWQLVPYAAWAPAFALGDAPLAAIASIGGIVLAALVARAFLPLDRFAALLMAPAAGWAVTAMLVAGA